MTNRRLPCPTRSTVRRVLGVLWLIDAALQAQPTLFTSDWWRTDLAGAAMGEPHWLIGWILWGTGTVAAHAVAWNAAFVALQALIGLALLTGRGARAACVLSVPWALAIWVLGEGMGMLPSGFGLLAAGAPGAVLLYALIGLLAWPGEKDGEPVARRAARGAWVGLWAGLSVLQLPLVFPARQVLTANVQELSQGLPQWQTSLAGSVGSWVGHHAVLASALMAAGQVAIGVGVLVRPVRRAALVTGIVVSLFYWVCFQYMGDITVSGATDPGTGPLMILLAWSLWPDAAGRELRRATVRGTPTFSRKISGALQVP